MEVLLCGERGPEPIYLLSYWFSTITALKIARQAAAIMETDRRVGAGIEIARRTATMIGIDRQIAAGIEIDLQTGAQREEKRQC